MKMTLSKGASLVLDRLIGAGFDAYVVGGSVRDALMSKAPSDFDVTSSALPEETKQLFCDFTTFDSGIKHGTVAVVIDGETVEITTFRSDGEYTDHRHPSGVSFTDRLEDDLSRRDFTVNAMAYNEKNGLIDLFDGVSDIANKLIRCVGTAQKRFDEDALRILRALRFSSTLDFEIDRDTETAIREKAHLLTYVSRERIYVELKKMLSGRGVGRVLSAYPDVIKVLFGDLTPNIDALTRADSDICRLAVFFKDAPSAFDTLKPSNHDKRLLHTAIELTKKELPKDRVAMKRLVVASSIEAFELSLDIRKAFGENVEAERTMLKSVSLDCLKKDDLAIGGGDIISAGVEPSARVGFLHDALFEAVISEEVPNERGALMKKLGEILNN